MENLFREGAYHESQASSSSV